MSHSESIAKLESTNNSKHREKFLILEETDLFLDPKSEKEIIQAEECSGEKISDSNCVGKCVLYLQRSVSRCVERVDMVFRGHLSKIVCLLLYTAYFSYAIYYRFGDEGSIRLLVCTILGIMIVTRQKIASLLQRSPIFKAVTSENRSPQAKLRLYKIRFFLRWIIYGCVAGFIAYIIIDVGLHETDKLRSLPGIVVFPLICFLFSSAPSKVKWHTIFWSIGLQFMLSVLIMRWSGGKSAILWIQGRLDEFFTNADPASRMLFGEQYKEHYLIFGAFPIIFLTNAALSMLYYLGAMQLLVGLIGRTLRFLLGTTVVESTGVAASIFMEGASALLALRPYLGGLTNSELFTLVTACIASIGGAYLAVLMQLGVSAEFLLPAMVITAPATFTICKLMVPETERPKQIDLNQELPKELHSGNLIEAAQNGANGVVGVVVNIVVSAFTFFAFISWANHTFVWFGDRVGIEQLTLQRILSYLLYPFSVLMGVEFEDCRQVAMLMGFRFVTSNFVSMLKLSDLLRNRDTLNKYLIATNGTITTIGDHIRLDNWNVTLIDGIISRRSEAIATYALCGFSGLISLAISMAVMVTLLPAKKSWLTSKAAHVLIAATLANFMAGNFAGLLAQY